MINLNNNVNTLEMLDISSKEKFHEILKRERSRADRNNAGFSLIVFEVSKNREIPKTKKSIVNIIKTKLRLYDEIGWFDEKRIAILLPETSVRGARTVAKEIFNAFHNVPDYNIFSYPSQKKDFTNLQQTGFDNIVNHKISYGYLTPLWKRSLDILLSSFALIVLSPLMFFVAVFIKVTSRGPVFFKQQRVGKSGKIFNLLKFRTIKVNNDDSAHREYLKKLITCDDNIDSPMVKLTDLGKDDRIIMFGKIIRNSSLDELPQFINVLRGEMSIVGPRPCIPYEAEEFLHWHKRRFDIIPGITGLWQVSGKNKTSFKEMIRLDIEYSKKRSLLLDLYIILKTPGVIIGQFFENLNKNQADIFPDILTKKQKDCPVLSSIIKKDS